VCELLNEFRYEDPLRGSGTTFIDPAEIGAGGYAPNPYVSLVEGHTHVLRAGEEREELVCVGESLDILASAECDIEDPEALREQLCSLSPDTFCVEPAAE
jgi:hypothetical protein